MLTRIGDAAQSALLRSTMLQTQGRLRDTQTAIATGNAFGSFRELGSDTGIYLRTHDAKARATAFVHQNDQVVDRLKAMDDALGSLGEIAERMRSLVVQRLDDATGREVPLDVEADAMLEEIQSQLNQKLDGRYLFAGSRTDTPPVAIGTPPPTAPDPTQYYTGDSVKLATRADSDAEVSYGVTADEAPFAQLIAAVGGAREGHLAGNRSAIQAALTQLTDAIDGLARTRGSIGATQSRLETITDGHRAAVLYLDEITARLADTDVAAAMTQLSQDQVTLEASFMTLSRVQGLSLADYLR